MGWAKLIALGTLVASSSAGCDHCEYGSVICRDNAVWSCVGTGAPLQWMMGAACEDTLCRVGRSSSGAPVGVCSVEDQPNPACPTGGGTVCAGGRVVSCDSGYVVRVNDTCASTDLCIAPGMPGVPQRLGQPFCAVSKTPDARCPAESAGDRAVFVTPHCFAGSLVECALGLLSSATDCGAPELCYTPSSMGGETEFPQPTCVASRMPDPRCPAGTPSTPFQRKALLCDGDQLLTCVDGLLAGTQGCGAIGCEHPPENASANCRTATRR